MTGKAGPLQISNPIIGEEQFVLFKMPTLTEHGQCLMTSVSYSETYNICILL